MVIGAQDSGVELFKNSCLAMCYAYLAGKDTAQDLIFSVAMGHYNGYIDADGYVSNPVAYLRMCGLVANDIKKVKISSIKELPEGVHAVEWAYGTSTHFVVCDNKSIVFDPLIDSKTLKYGKPVSFRMIV